MVTLVPTWVSPGHGESDPHLCLNVPGDSRSDMDIMWTWWLQCFELLIHLVALVPTRASPGPGEYGCHLHITWTLLIHVCP